MDLEDDPDKPGEQRISFRAVEGLQPPAAVELAGTGPDLPADPTTTGE